MISYDPCLILFTHLSNEQNCIDILPYGFDIISFFRELIQYQTNKYLVCTENTDTSYFSYLLRRGELERINFLMKSYHRLRIWKIEKFFVRSEKKNYFRYLSRAEKKYARIYEYFFLKKLGEIVSEVLSLEMQRCFKIKSFFLIQEKIFKRDYFVFFKVIKKKNFFDRNILGIEHLDVFYGNDIYCMKYRVIKNLILSRIVYLL